MGQTCSAGPEEGAGRILQRAALPSSVQWGFHALPLGASWSPSTPTWQSGDHRPTWREWRVGGHTRPGAGSREPAGQDCVGTHGQACRVRRTSPAESAPWTSRDRALVQRGREWAQSCSHRTSGPQDPRWSRQVGILAHIFSTVGWDRIHEGQLGPGLAPSGSPG